MKLGKGLAGLLVSAAVIYPFVNEGFAEEPRKNSHVVSSRKFEGKLPVNKIYREVYEKYEGKPGMVKVQSYDCFITAEKGSLKLYLININGKGEATDILFRDDELDGSLEEYLIDGASKKTPEQKEIAESFYRVVVENILSHFEDEEK